MSFHRLCILNTLSGKHSHLTLRKILLNTKNRLPKNIINISANEQSWENIYFFTEYFMRFNLNE